MSRYSQNESDGLRQLARGREFENLVGAKLRPLFERVEPNPRIKGLSGVGWKVDFLVDSRLIVEVSVQKRLETKISSTFLKFVDICRGRPDFRAALVLETLAAGISGKKRAKKVFPTSEYRTMIQYGFPILVPDEVQNLSAFLEGRVSAPEASSKPSDFNPKSLRYHRQAAESRILEILAKTPMPRREIARVIGRSPW